MFIEYWRPSTPNRIFRIIPEAPMLRFSTKGVFSAKLGFSSCFALSFYMSHCFFIRVDLCGLVDGLIYSHFHCK